MNDVDPRWIDQWSHTPFQKNETPFFDALAQLTGHRYGEDRDPHSSIWMSSISLTMGEHFREGMTVLDYGCGAGRYAHHLQGRLQRFKYFGVERAGASGGHGEDSIKVAGQLFGSDQRIQFGFIGSDLDCEAITPTRPYWQVCLLIYRLTKRAKYSRS